MRFCLNVKSTTMLTIIPTHTTDQISSLIRYILNFCSGASFLCSVCNIQLLPLSEGEMTICSPEAGEIARGRSRKAILHVEGTT